MSGSEDKTKKEQTLKLKLNPTAPSYIPKGYAMQQSAQDGQQLTYSSYSFQPKTFSGPNVPQHSVTKEMIRSSKPYIPKSLTKDQEKKTVIKDHYFIVDEQNTKKKVIKFTYEYMISFEKWEICSEEKLLTDSLLNHIKSFSILEEETPKSGIGSHKGKEKYKNKRDYLYGQKNKESSSNDTFARNENENVDLKKWGRKDLTKEYAAAEEFKQKIIELRKKDPIKFHLTELLNILTVDNYETTKDEILKVIEPNVEYQEKFLDVLFKKAVHEKAFVFLYAKLCKELDKKLPQKIQPTQANKKPTSAMRARLLDKCREIFKIENNEKFDHYIKVSDKEERAYKLKKFILGNVNFIGELINIQVLSKKIVFQCIENLFKRFEKEETDEMLRSINLEAIVIMMDKFGTLLKKTEKKIKPDDMKAFNAKIDEYIEKLDNVKDGKIPSFVKYGIINLVEKKKGGWKESQFQKSTIAKSKEEVRKEFIESQKATFPIDSNGYDQDEINEKIRSDLKNWKEYIEEGNKPDDYDWSVVEDIYVNKKNFLAQILTAYAETCIDFVQNPKDLEYANEYFRQFISYYKLTKEEKIDITQTAIKLMKNVNDFALDNFLIVDVWGNIMYYLMEYDIMRNSDLNKLVNLKEEEIESLFKVYSVAVKLNENLKKDLMNMKHVKENKVLFDSIVK